MWDKYPSTDLHDINLDWVIRTVDEMKTTLSNFTVQFDEFKERFEEVVSQFDQWEGRIDALELNVESIERNVSDLYEHIETLREYIETEVADATATLRAELSEVDNESRLRDGLISADVTLLKADLDEEVVRLDGKIDTLEFDLPLVNNMVIGGMTSIQEYIDDVYNALRYNALTNNEYAALDLTNAQYETYNLTNEQYAIAGKLLLGA